MSNVNTIDSTNPALITFASNTERSWFESTHLPIHPYTAVVLVIAVVVAAIAGGIYFASRNVKRDALKRAQAQARNDAIESRLTVGQSGLSKNVQALRARRRA